MRKEFEASRNEKDPQIIAKMIVVGRDCMMNIKEKVLFKKGMYLKPQAAQRWHFPGYNEAIINEYGKYQVFDFQRKKNEEKKNF